MKWRMAVLAAALLELNGYAVLKAENAEDGLKFARERKPDLVLTSFRDKYKDTDILATGANAFLPKPYHHQDFLNTVQSLLGR